MTRRISLFGFALLMLLCWTGVASAQNIITPAYDVNRTVYVANAIDKTEQTHTPERVALAVFVVKLYSIDNDLYCPNPSPNFDANFSPGTALRLMLQALDKYSRYYGASSKPGNLKFVMRPYDVAAAMLGFLAEQPGNPIANTLTTEALNFQTCVGNRVDDQQPAYLQQSNALGGSRVASGFSQYERRFFEKMFDLARQNAKVASVVDAFFGPLFKCSVLDNSATILKKNTALRDSQNFAPFVSLIQADGRIITTKTTFNSQVKAFSARMNSVTTTAMNTLATLTAYQKSSFLGDYLQPNPTALAQITAMQAVITPQLQGSEAAAYALPFTIQPDPRYTAYQQSAATIEVAAKAAQFASSTCAAASPIAELVSLGGAALQAVADGLELSVAALDCAAAFGAFGPSDEEVIMDGINQLSDQLFKVQQQINARLDIVDSKLDTIYSVMNSQFDAVKSYLTNINATLNQVQNQVRAMQLQINTVQMDIYRLTEFIYNFATLSLRVSSGLISSLDEIDTISRNGSAVDISEYTRLYGIVKSYALSNASSAAETSDWKTNRPYGDGDLVKELSAGPFPEWNINYMLEFARRKWGLPLGPSYGIANPHAWAMSVMGMMRLAAAKPDFFFQTTLNDSLNRGDGFYGARNLGFDIQDTVADCALQFNVSTNRYEKSLLFRRLLDFQQQKAVALFNAITAVENAAGGTLANRVAAVKTQWNAQTPTNEGVILQQAIKELDGSRRLLDKFVEFALSRSLVRSEFLSSALFSPQRLPDARVVYDPNEANPATARSLYGKYNGEATNPKDTFAAIQNERWTATDSLIQGTLDGLVANTPIGSANPVGESLAEVENVMPRFGYFCLSRIAGKVAPKANQGQFIAGEPIYITFRSRTRSQPTFTLTTKLDASNAFQVAVPPDLYDVLIRTAKYLQKGVYGVDARNGSIPLSSNKINLQLTVGEIFFDNRIDNRDMVALRNAWNTKPGDARWNPLADLNSDGVVDQKDLTLLRSAGIWGQIGDN